jgi:N utilization substance protein A
MNNEFFAALELLEKEEGIAKQYMLNKVELALTTAYKREWNGYDNVEVVINEAKKEVKVYQLKEVVEVVEDAVLQITRSDALKYDIHAAYGKTIRIEIDPKKFRRLSAQNGKQMIIQGSREAKREKATHAYSSKKEEIISTLVDRVDPETGNVIVETSNGLATLMASELIPGDHFDAGDHIKVFISEVNHEVKGPIVTLSRTHPNFVKRLFELEVPEIQDGTVIIKNISREPGSRTKMSVYSNDENVDPVGTCIGNRRMRINSVIKELSGEKIDVIRYSENPEEYIAAALAPATVREVILADNERSCQVLVNEDQLSLAIGKFGQNARLAARLTGYKIDIKTK